MDKSIYRYQGEIVKGSNNFWLKYDADCDTVIVFVHGIFSDSLDCWTHRNSTTSREVYWPSLIEQDNRRIGNVGIYMGGFYTAIDAGAYDIFNCSYELFSSISRIDRHGNKPVIQFQKIVFVCHSTGGIVVRHLICKQSKAFAGKYVGLVLIASPSSGSELASTLKGLSEIYNSKLAAQLAYQSPAIEELDRNFKDLVHDHQRGFEINGVEAYENKFIIHRKWLPFNRIRVVTEASAGKYFGAPVHLPNTDHFSAVKPTSIEDAQHLLLLDFIKRIEKNPVEKTSIKPDEYNLDVPISLSPNNERTNTSNQIKITFDSLFSPSQLGVVRLLSMPLEIGSENCFAFAKELTILQKTMTSVLEEISHGKPNWWKDVADSSSIEDFYEGAARALRKSLDLTHQIRNRLPVLLHQMSRESQCQIAVGFTPPRVAVTNFLKLGSFQIGLDVAYWASYEPVRDRFDLTEWIKFLTAKSRIHAMGLLLSPSEEICSARVQYVGDYELVNGNYGYLYGPRQSVIECHRKHEKFFPAIRWYYEWIIPQIELHLAQESSVVQVVYDQSIIPTGVVKDLAGKEIW